VTFTPDGNYLFIEEYPDQRLILGLADGRQVAGAVHVAPPTVERDGEARRQAVRVRLWDLEAGKYTPQPVPGLSVPATGTSYYRAVLAQPTGEGQVEAMPGSRRIRASEARPVPPPVRQER
jgi:hypothetical protein